MDKEEMKVKMLELSKYPMDVLKLLAQEGQEAGDYLLLSHLYYIMYLKIKES